jgi:hypothetical protein
MVWIIGNQMVTCKEEVVEHHPSIVMPGLVPGIHVSAAARRTWMAGTKPGHDEK